MRLRHRAPAHRGTVAPPGGHPRGNERLGGHRPAVVGQDDVAPGQADVLRAGRPRVVHTIVELPDAEREGEGVRRPPVHLQDGGPGEGIGAGAGLLVQAHGVAVGRVGVLGAPVGRAGVLRPAGDQAQRFLQDQDVPPVQIEAGRRPGQGGPGGATGEQAAGIAPGVEGDGVARGAEGQVVQGLEGQGPPAIASSPCSGVSTGTAPDSRDRIRVPGRRGG